MSKLIFLLALLLLTVGCSESKIHIESSDSFVVDDGVKEHRAERTGTYNAWSYYYDISAEGGTELVISYTSSSKGHYGKVTYTIEDDENLMYSYNSMNKKGTLYRLAD